MGLVLWRSFRESPLTRTRPWVPGTHGLLRVVRADKKPYLIYQKPNASPSEWIQSIQANIKWAEATGGKIGGGEHVSQYLADLEGVDLTTLAPDKLADF